ncbi:MAG: hypothetical protein IH898_10540, partial [Planctomycetes bacterium]|nr:hypothetical protein [Planctomycetota bacterium]
MIDSKSFQWQIWVLGKPLCVLLAAGLILFTGASNGLAQTTIVDFDEALTAMMDNPANGAASVMSGNISGQTWSLRDGLDDEIELEKIETDGAGSLSADLFTTKARFEGSLFLGFANGVTDSPGKNLAVMTVVVDPWDFIPVDVKGTRSRYRRIRKIWEKEEERFGFGDTSSTNTTAIFRLQREVAGGVFGSDVVTLVGDAGDDDVETA